MLSRVAEHLYWIGRYMERVENTGRIVAVNSHLLLDLPRGIAPGWRPLVAITGGEAQFEERFDEYSERNVVRFLVGDSANPASMLTSMSCARENARTVRDFLPQEAWQLINELYLFMKDELATGLAKRTRTMYLDRVRRDAHALIGALSGSMNRDAGQAFMELGRMIERADMTTRIIDVRSATLLPDVRDESPMFENIQWISVLKSLSAYQMYRRKMQVRVRRKDALRFLLADDAFPRAVYFCVSEASAQLARMPRSAELAAPFGRLLRTISAAPMEELVENHGELTAFIDALQRELAGVHDLISRTYFLRDEDAVAHSGQSQVASA